MEKIKIKETLILIGISIIIIALILACNIAREKEIMQEDEATITNSNALTMMYETEAGSGEYEVVSDTTWPQEGYKFNAELSRCENGGTLTWNDETNKVVMRSKTSDKCYAYFDIYVELNYAYLADSNQPYLDGGDAISYVTDEITYMFDNYSGSFELYGSSIIKSSVASNLNNVLNYGLNSAVYIKDSPDISLDMGTINASGNGALGMYIINSEVTFGDITISSTNTNVPAIIINNSNFNMNAGIISGGDIMMQGTSTFIAMGGMWNNIIISANSIATINMGGGTFLGQITVEDNANVNITNNALMQSVCINNANNQNAQIYFENNGTLNLTCDSYVTGFSTTYYDNIYSNGYNIYYDRTASPQLNGETIALDGGGSLMPFN